ncbi:hypothetical protein NPS70_00845 [Streptomyces sp. C10-9-1]|uniref:hypothetical protein n=1 Tax=Streptomyces sp. C10-9-1 TaxID=1859285 RepID=UPI002111B8F7|nr:hypothetical protein [Streptomyces sp. C10-9-1]MCQ6551752.1 hypothetical protein [Streptomyces sp. C10-9-1]
MRTGVRWQRVAFARPPAADPGAVLPGEPTPAPARTGEAAEAARGRGRAGAAATASRERGSARPAFCTAAGTDRPPDAPSGARGKGGAAGLLSKTVKR